MNPQKMKDIESEVRTDGKGTPRREKVPGPSQPNKTNVSDAKKLQNAALDKCGLTPAPTITELKGVTLPEDVLLKVSSFEPFEITQNVDGDFLGFEPIDTTLGAAAVEAKKLQKGVVYKEVDEYGVPIADSLVASSSKPFEVTQNNDDDFVLLGFEPIDTTRTRFRAARTTAVFKRAIAQNAALDKCRLTPAPTITELKGVTLPEDVLLKVSSFEPFEITQNIDGDFLGFEPIDTTLGRAARTTAVFKRATAVEAKKLQKGKGKTPPTATVTSSSQLLPLDVFYKEVDEYGEPIADSLVASSSKPFEVTQNNDDDFVLLGFEPIDTTRTRFRAARTTAVLKRAIAQNAALDKCRLTPAPTITELKGVTLPEDVLLKVSSFEPFEITQNIDGDFLGFEPIDTTLGRAARTTAVFKRATAVEAKKLQKGKGKTPPTATVTSSSQLLPLAVVNKKLDGNDVDVADAPVASTSKAVLNKRVRDNDEMVADDYHKVKFMGGTTYTVLKTALMEELDEAKTKELDMGNNQYMDGSIDDAEKN